MPERRLLKQHFWTRKKKNDNKQKIFFHKNLLRTNKNYDKMPKNKIALKKNNNT
jgi:hypothetical protein